MKDYLELAKKAVSNEGRQTFALIAIADELRGIRQMMETPEPVSHVGREDVVKADLLQYQQGSNDCKCLLNSACPEHGEAEEGRSG